jgi:hypothetical protein
MGGPMEYTKRRNLNRGYMKLDVWQRGMDLFELKRENHTWQDTLPQSNNP